jgi:S-adenosylmethionine decarboxylase
MHLIFDGFGANHETLQSEDAIYRILDQYPSRIGMTKVAPPQVFRYVGSKPEDWGVSGFVVIAESHISIHTFPERRYANIDIFSCRDFDPELAIKELKQSFQFTDIRTHLLMRGLQDAPAAETAELNVG